MLLENVFNSLMQLRNYMIILTNTALNIHLLIGVIANSARDPRASYVELLQQVLYTLDRNIYFPILLKMTSEYRLKCKIWGLSIQFMLSCRKFTERM